MPHPLLFSFPFLPFHLYGTLVSLLYLLLLHSLLYFPYYICHFAALGVLRGAPSRVRRGARICCTSILVFPFHRFFFTAGLCNIRGVGCLLGGVFSFFFFFFGIGLGEFRAVPRRCRRVRDALIVMR